MIGGFMALMIIATAIISFLHTPYDPNRMNLSERFLVSFDQALAGDGPVWAGHPQPGYERIDQFPDRRLGGGGARPGSIGVLLGSLAAYWRGWRDEGIMRLADVFYGFPAVLSAILITSILGPGMVNSMLAIGIFYIPIFARLTRGASLSVWQRDYVTSARAIGQTNRAIIWSTILPNILSPLIVQATVQFAIAILAEAALSYLGLGTQPPHASWGRMLNEAQTFMEISPWLAIFPGMAIAVAVLGFNLLGDGLRDLLDPRFRRQKT